MKQKKINKIIPLMFIIFGLLFFWGYKIQEKPQNTIKVGIIDSYIPKETLDNLNITSINYTNSFKKTSNLHGRTTLKIIQDECKSCEIYYASVLNENNESSIENVILAMEWCIEQEVDIICMSFATCTDDKMLQSAVKKAIDNKIIVTASCFNLSNVNCYPAMYKNVISVSDGMNKNATIIIKNRKTVVELDGKKYEKTGTSISNAFVCGVIAKEFTKGNKNIKEIVKKLNSG